MGDVLIRSRKRKTGTVYEYYFEIASVDGSRKWTSKGGFKTKKEAKEAGKKAQELYEKAGQVVTPSEMSVSDFLDMWIEKDCRTDLKDVTVAGYEKKIRLYIKPQLGNRLGEAFALTREDIDLDKQKPEVNRQVQWFQDKTRTKEKKKSENGSSKAGEAS